jgi:hypothetical protein
MTNPPKPITKPLAINIANAIIRMIVLDSRIIFPTVSRLHMATAIYMTILFHFWECARLIDDITVRR